MFLLMSVCLLSAPATCHEERINMSLGNPNPFICMRNSQSALAEWQGNHPDLSIKTWRCAAKASLPKDL
ncbi:hypothetical protein FV217_10245 [Methylobacterium sp. WL9]|uniref:Secreted protein n=1 Tax=Methylobacterium thuringiense TaxID=1003091 RepID=A0ABQ4TJ67_9HYPH|nr:hypothetical protein FV217_10245 [Methylobacterium sp. WL9]GJE54060.1 hypothetical protein EKPJFOCH_0532 [Methylobacterium thuringiense]